jgi:predicted dehydrogenase
VSICGKSSQRMGQYCKKFNIKRYDDWKEMIQKEKPQAIAVAVIPFYQYEIVKFALENNIAVFAEKPLTTSYETSLKLYDLVKEKQLPNMIDFIFPEISQWREAKNIIENDGFGKITKINVNWSFFSHDLKNNIISWKTDIQKGGGALSYFFSHGLYYLEYFIGNIKNIQCINSSCDVKSNNSDVLLNMKILFENGCLGNIHLDISNKTNQIHKIEFQSKTHNSLILKNITNNYADNFELILNGSTKKIKVNSTETNSNYNELEDPRVNLVSNIAKRFIEWCMTGKKSKPDFYDGVRVQELIEIIRKTSNNKIHQD